MAKSNISLENKIHKNPIRKLREQTPENLKEISNVMEALGAGEKTSLNANVIDYLTDPKSNLTQQINANDQQINANNQQIKDPPHNNPSR